MVQEAFQNWLDRTIDAYMDNDFDAYRGCFQLPVSFVTDRSMTLITDDALLQKGFHAFRQMLVAQKVTHLIRRATEMVELGGHLISGGYVTHILKDAVYICPAYNSTATLRNVDGIWKAVNVSSGLINASFPIVVPRVGV